MTTPQTNPSQQPVMEPTQGINPWLVRVPMLFIMGGMLTVITLAVLLFVFQISISGKVVPGVSAAGVSLGGMTQPEAEAALANTFSYSDDTVFTFRHGDQFWQMTAGELGVRFDAEATAKAATDIGQSASPAVNLIKQATIWSQGFSVAPIMHYDETVARAKLTTIASEIGRPPQAASLKIEGLNVITMAAASGIFVDIETALQTLSTQVQALQPGGEIRLDVIETTPPENDVENAAAYIRTAISAPLTLVSTDANGNQLGPWLVKPEQIAAMLTVETVTNTDSSITYSVNVDMSGFASTLETLAPGLIIPAMNGRYTFNDETRELETLVASVNGRELDIATTIERMEAVVFNVSDRTVELAFNYIEPPYHDGMTAVELGITEMVSSSRTLYTGSTAARRTNIENAAAMYNGMIVAPDETFSFNEIVGDISEENGFVEGAIIFGGRTVKGIGGGVCQVSTTAFRAAFNGGYPIVERYSHGYRVGYYELDGFGPGLDAAIFTPTADFKFTNDTAYHLLIETEFLGDENALVFRFYSTNPGRTIEVSNPIQRSTIPPTATVYEVNNDLQWGQQLQVDWSQEGGDIVVTRTIRDEQGNILEKRDYPTFYQPWSAVIQVPPGDPRLGANSNS